MVKKIMVNPDKGIVCVVVQETLGIHSIKQRELLLERGRPSVQEGSVSNTGKDERTSQDGREGKPEDNVP